MIPVPHDPLALPYSNKSDPLRGPMFIPLNISCLEESSGTLFTGNNDILLIKKFKNKDFRIILINYYE